MGRDDLPGMLDEATTGEAIVIQPSQTPDSVHLVLVPEGPGPLPEDRMRRFLKAILRGYGLRAVWIGSPALCRECLNPVTKTRREKRHAKPVRAAG